MSKGPDQSSWPTGAVVVAGLLFLIGIFAFLTNPGVQDAVTEPIADFLLPTTEPPTGVAGTSTTAVDPTSASIPQTVPNPNYFTATVSCPAPGGGYTIDGRAAIVLDGRIRVSATIADEARFIGELQPYRATEPITGLAPNESVGFDIQSVDRSGQAGESYHIDVVTPAAPC